MEGQCLWRPKKSLGRDKVLRKKRIGRVLKLRLIDSCLILFLIDESVLFCFSSMKMSWFYFKFCTIFLFLLNWILCSYSRGIFIGTRIHGQGGSSETKVSLIFIVIDTRNNIRDVKSLRYIESSQNGCNLFSIIRNHNENTKHDAKRPLSNEIIMSDSKMISINVRFHVESL